MKGSIGIILAVVLAAGCQDEQPPVETQKLFLPKEEPASDSVAYTDSSLTLILTSGDILYYTGKLTDESPVDKVDYKGVRKVISDFKKKAGGKMVVLIKPHANATYKNTVDILDEMTINKIKRYALVDLSDEEKEKLLNEPSAGTPESEAVSFPESISTPKSVTTSVSVVRRKGIVITLHADNTVSYSIDSLVNAVQAIKISPPTKNNIKEVISNYKKSLGTQGDQINVLIKGQKEADYDSYKNIIQALKDLGIYKFSLVTIPENKVSNN